MSIPVQRRPFLVRCGVCEHRWAPLYLPMQMMTAVRILSNTHCPRCGASSKEIFAVDEPKPSGEGNDRHPL